MEVYLFIIALMLSQLLVTKESSEKKFAVGNYDEFTPQLKSQMKFRDKKSIIILLDFIILLTIFAFRNLNVGIDTNTYYDMYVNINVKDISLIKEPVFWVLAAFTKMLNLPFYCLLILIGIVTLIGFYIIIVKASDTKVYSLYFFVLLGIYSSSFNGMRQFMALSFFVLAFNAMINNKCFDYVIYCLLATLCHQTAIVLFPFYLLKYIKLNWKILSVAMCLCIVLIFTFPFLTKIVSKFTSKDYYNLYLVKGLFKSSITLYSILYIIGMFMGFIWFYKMKKYIKNDDKNKYELFLMMFYISCCIRFVATFSGYFSLINRFAMYFFWSLIVILPYTIAYFPFPKFKCFYNLCLECGAVIYFLISVLVRETGGIYPYNLTNEISQNGKFAVLLSIVTISIYTILQLRWRNPGYEKISKHNNTNI